VNTDITLADIRAAAERIRSIAHRTPVFTSRTFDDLAGAHVFFKCENFQRGGAFKIRGASNFIYSIPKDQLSRGVVTYSSGNHAQAVAIAAASVGIKATIVMPQDAPKSKLTATRGYGAEVVTYDRLTGIGRPSANGSRKRPVRPSSRRTIIHGPSPGKARRRWSFWKRCLTSKR
jgi:threonine dehydratase